MKKLMLFAALFAANFGMQAQLLWKVSAPGSDKDSYIVGTHHLAPQGMIDSISGLQEAIKDIDAVYGEVDMTTMTPEVQQKAMSIMMAPTDSTLNKVLTKEQYDSVGAVIDKYFQGMANIDQLAIMKPAAISTQIALMQNMAAFPGFNPAEQFDSKIQQQAKILGKQTCGFETMDFQLGLLYGDAIGEQAESLMKAVRNDEKSLEMSKKLSQAYSAGNLDDMLEIMTDEELGMDKEGIKKLITDRNENWVALLKTVVPEKSVLVAVGAGHLPGEKGILSLLKGLGFTVTPVR